MTGFFFSFFYLAEQALASLPRKCREFD